MITAEIDFHQAENVVRKLTFVVSSSSRGPAGIGGDQYEHVQSSAALTWIVNHNFGKRPIIEVLNSAGQPVTADILHISLAQAQVSFNQPQAGTAIAR